MRMLEGNPFLITFDMIWASGALFKSPNEQILSSILALFSFLSLCSLLLDRLESPLIERERREKQNRR